MNKMEAGKKAVSQAIILFENIGLTQEVERTRRLIDELNEMN
jgi:hypothetical protein